MLKTNELFDLKHTLATAYLEQFIYPWEALAGIKNLIITLGSQLDPDQYQEIMPQVWVHKTAKVYPSAFLGNPCIIGSETEIRHGAFIRSSALIGNNCVVGNSVELKNVILFDHVEVPHYNYVGDSILGYHAHMGAGSITSNVKADRKEVIIHADRDIQTGLKKMGAILGDYVEIGCNAVLNPGTIVGKNSHIYPLCNVRGVIEENTILKSNGIQVKIQ